MATDKAGDIYMSVTRHVSTSPTFVDMGSRFYFRGISDHARQIPSVMSWAAAVMGTFTEVWGTSESRDIPGTEPRRRSRF